MSKSVKSTKSIISSKSPKTTTDNEARKLSGIVYKMESLISRIHLDKLNNHSNDSQSKNSKCRQLNSPVVDSDQIEQQNSVDDDEYDNNKSKMKRLVHRSASLDSLNNLTEPESFEDNDDANYSGSDAEIAHITGKTSVQVHQHQFKDHQTHTQHFGVQRRRGSDLDELNDLSIKDCHTKGGTFDFESAWSVIDEDDVAIENDDIDNNVCKVDETFKFNQSQSGSSCSMSSSSSKTGRPDSNNNYKDINFMDDDKSKINYNGNGSISSGSSSIASSTKNRRTSITSSGSVGRMETILEEPIEAKISVKEILARFETMSTSEAQTKSSTISSGARAAAQTLNVPIESLESRQSNHRESSQGRDVVESYRRNSREDGVDSQIINNHSYQHKTQQLQSHHNGLLDEEAGHSGHTPNNDLVNEIPLEKENRQEKAESQHFIKQQSYLHSRKISASHMHHQEQQQQLQLQQQQHTKMMESNSYLDDSYPETPPSVTKYSLLQFAMQHFRNDHPTDHRPNERTDRRASSNFSYADLVKWQGSPIRAPLLRLPTDLSPLALECFDCILRYCGDVPLDPELTEVKCVYTVLMHCHKYLALRDEVYCQLMKQTTANRSPCPDSSQRAWRLLSILAAYFGCSDALRPYLMEHLTSAASDRRRSCHGTAAVCLTNLRKTARCGGRKNVPSVEEVTAVSAGRSARRQIYRLPGGAERVVNTRCSTVVADVITELCALLGVDSEAEQQEFSLYCIVQGDAFTMPLAADEYILDVTTELLKSGQPFYLIFCRSVWHFPLKRDPAPTPLYIEVLFNQVAPDYLEGLLLEVPGNGGPLPEVVRDMARIAALLHRAADLNHVPAMKEIKFLLPKPALGIREIRPAQWVSLVQSVWPAVSNLSSSQVKAQFLNVLSAWPLFGSSFFAVKRIWTEERPHVEESNPMWRDLILALNRSGVLFLDPNTHEAQQHWPFMEVISTRKVRSEDGALFLDMKVGNLMQQRVIRVQTEQAHEISRLVRQYITMAQICQREKLN